MHFRCPNCQNPIDLVGTATEETVDQISCPSCNSGFSLADTEEDETLIEEPHAQIGHFRLTRLLGKGGFGQVYEAEDLELKRKVAIKIPWSHKVDRDSSSAVLKEAQAAAVVQHPNVVKVFEVGALDKGLYIVSELVDGIDLGRWLENKKLSFQQRASLLAEICDGVQAAHAAGVIHRDLKPSNILMTKQGRPLVTDFGVARRRISGQTTVTKTGQVFGTLKYMSPEQASGSTGLVDERSDVFSLGVVLYRLLTNRVPFTGKKTDMATILVQITSDEATSPREHNPAIPKDIATICLKCLEKNPDRRYQSARELSEDLRRFADGQAVHARPISLPERLWRKVRRSPVTSSALAVAAVAVCVVVWQASLPAAKPETIEREVVIAPEDVSYPTTISVRRADGAEVSDCRWCVLPLDRYRRAPIVTEKLDFEGDPQITAPLTPGDYLIVVDIPGYGFHEVYRRIPRLPDTEGMMGIHCRNWTNQDDHFYWPDVVVRSYSDVTRNLILIPGGEYRPGGNASVAPPGLIESFWVAGTEFTEQQKRLQSGGRPTPESDWTPAIVSAIYADHLAEQAGCRLPLEWEFEYLATNFGTTKVPNGNPADYDFAARTIGDATLPGFDRMLNYEVYNLHWNAPEWTSGGGIPLTIPQTLKNEFLENEEFHKRRAVRGGPTEVGNPDSVYDREIPPETQHSLSISFRLVVSVRPRYLTNPEE